MKFHPASLLLLWGAGVATLQWLPLSVTLVATLAFMALAAWRGRPLFFRLLSRSRWLFLTMGLLFLCFTPGIRLPSPWGELGMTRDGLAFALEHMGRLATMVALLALLLTRLSHGGVVAGCYFLLPPIGPLAEVRRAIAVRLMLTLESVAGKAERGRGEWKSLLAAEPAREDNVTDNLRLDLPAWAWRDSGLVLVILSGAVLLAISLGMP